MVVTGTTMPGAETTGRLLRAFAYLCVGGLVQRPVQRLPNEFGEGDSPAASLAAGSSHLLWAQGDLGPDHPLMLSIDTG